MNFNWAHVHLLLNHFPTVGMIVGFGLFVVSLLRKDEGLQRASLVVLLVIAILALPVYMTGNAAYEIIQGHPGVSGASVAKHQDAAALALIFMMITGAFVWLALWHFRRKSRPSQASLFAILLSSIVTLGLMTQAATLGGEIRHEEIRSAQAAAGAEATGTVSSIGSYVTSHGWVWPTCEIFHYLGLSLLFGTALVVNLRILGFMRAVPLHAFRRLLPLGLAGFGINIITGMIFFIATPTQYTQNIAFHWKIVFLLVALVNTLYLTFDESWALESGQDSLLRYKVIAAAGIFLWTGVIFWGRMLPYIGNSF